jgi:hypothetical protein
MSEEEGPHVRRAKRLESQLCALIASITKASIEGTEANTRDWARTLAAYIEDIGGYAESMELDPRLYTIEGDDPTDLIEAPKRKRVKSKPSTDA